MFQPIVRPLSAAILLGSAVLVTACGGSSTPRMAPVPPREVGAFVVRLGNDTIAVEQFGRTRTQLEGRQVVRSPRTTFRDYTAALAPDGSIVSFEVNIRNAPAAAPTTHARIEYAGGTATVVVTRDGATETFRVAAEPVWIPALGYSFALYELPLVQLRGDAQRSELSASIVPIGGADALSLTLTESGEDSVRIRNIAGESRARVDPEGRLLAWDGRGSTLQVTAERAVMLDLERLGADFAARDAAGRTFGALSPRDSVQAAIAGATLSISYGRPLARGRQIFGGVVPWNQVWRTGANQATHFRTDRDLVVGGTPVPSGSYTLFTIPAPDGWRLIINRQTGQWGTVHDAAQDLARIPMQAERLAEPVEQFTITLEPREGGGVLRMAWGDTRASVPFEVR